MRETLRTRRFWLDAYGLTTPERAYTELSGGVPLPLASGASLRVMIRPDHEEGELLLCRRLRRSVPLGWYDGMTAWTSVLRWSEVEAIGRTVERRGGPPHPGVPVLLLARYAPILSDADAERAWWLTSAAWDRLGLFDAHERHELFAGWDHRGRHASWRNEGGRWLLEATRDCASVSGDRTADNPGFPHAVFAALETSARGAAPVPASERAPPAHWSHVVRVEVRSATDSAPPVHALGRYFDRALRHAALGRAHMFVHMSTPRATTAGVRVVSNGDARDVWARLSQAASAFDPTIKLLLNGQQLCSPTPGAQRGRYGQLLRLVVEDRRVAHLAFARPLLPPQREIIARAQREPPEGLALQVAEDVQQSERLDGVSVLIDRERGAASLLALGRAAGLSFFPPYLAFTEATASALRVAEPNVILARTPEEVEAALR
ncbi:MAG: hypothetical protein SangKO_025440 [Sandaracinaceae bacterium]